MKFKWIYVVQVGVVTAIAVTAFYVYQQAQVAATKVVEVTANASQVVRDAMLVVRPNAEFAGHDERGFRNARGTSVADVVIFGDSQTYGPGVQLQETWPSLLQELSRKSVYQVAFGTFGPAHYLPLLGHAFALKAKTVVVALYLGNDLAEAYKLVHKVPGENGVRTAADRNLDRFAEVTPKIAKKLQEREALDPDFATIKAYDCQKVEVVQLINLRAGGLVDEIPDGKLNENTCAPAKLSDGTEIVFNAAFRLATMTDRDPRISEGARLTVAALAEMRRQLSDTGSTLVVVQIPTKELVYQGLVADPPFALQKLWEVELARWQSLTAELIENSIEVIDVLPALRTSAANGSIPYALARGESVRDDANGHPTPVGYRVIAERVKIALEMSIGH